jgi:hypothetical protein
MIVVYKRAAGSSRGGREPDGMDDELKRIRLDTALAVDKVAPPLLFRCCSFYLSVICPAFMPVCPIFSRCLGAREAEIEKSSSRFCVPEAEAQQCAGSPARGCCGTRRVVIIISTPRARSPTGWADGDATPLDAEVWAVGSVVGAAVEHWARAMYTKCSTQVSPARFGKPQAKNHECTGCIISGCRHYMYMAAVDTTSVPQSPSGLARG